MQQVQQRELPERISWARAMIFAVGFFFIAAMLIGQLPSYFYNQMTASTLEGFEQGSLALGVTCLAGFAIIQVIMLLFDPKPVIPPVILTGLGAILSLAGAALALWVSLTGNQYFPKASTAFAPLLSGKFLWFQANAVDFVMIGLAILWVGLAMIFYSILAMGEMRNPDRRDLGTTPAIRWMLVGSILLLIIFMVAYTYVQNLEAKGLVTTLVNVLLAAAVFMAFGAFALRMHYLMRPVRKRTMAGLYAIGALGLAQFGAVLILLWLVAYPLIALIHPWTFIGLGKYLTNCARETAVPVSCSFSQDAGYLFDAIITTNFFVLLMGAVWAWRSNRNLVVVGSVVITATIAASALLVHTAPKQITTAMMVCIGILVLSAIWSSVARREFAVVGENNLGCLGMWLVMGTCLFIYLAAFAFFSMPAFNPIETPPNIPFTSGSSTDAFVMLVLLGVLAGIQFFFLTRNRYKV